MTSPALVWFRRDLRLDDNPAWSAATALHDEVTALFVLDDDVCQTAGSHRRAQLLAELHALDRTLAESGGRLRVVRGRTESVVPGEVRRSGAHGLYLNRDVSPASSRRDDAVRRMVDLPVHEFDGTLVVPPGAVLTKTGTVPRQFGAFHRAWQAVAWDPWPTPGNARIASQPGDPLPVPDHEPTAPPGTAGALDRLADFLERVDRYDDDRDRIDVEGTSSLSIALKFGTISPRQLVERIGNGTAGRDAFVRQLCWRDWYAHLLVAFPTLIDQALDPRMRGLRWENDPNDIAAWKEGRTGYPIVDAGMRQLARTGRMHNRVRMIAASFLVKDLLVDWRIGERHFRELLADADVSQNVGNWQWSAGTGPDAAPWFRIFNPVRQSRRFDPRGAFIRQWVPELGGLDDDALHAPWELGSLELQAAGVRLGDDYPHAIVDHAWARDRALARYRAAREHAR